MRFLVSEKSYEQLLGSGNWQYQRNGVPTGVVEQWRWTVALEGYHIVRVDVDGRSAEQESYLYHLIQDLQGTPLRLTYRYWDNQGKISGGNVLWTEETILNRCEAGGKSFTQELPVHPFSFGSIWGWGMLARIPFLKQAVLLEEEFSAGEKKLSLVSAELRQEPQESPYSILLNINGQKIPTRAITLRWSKWAMTIWADRHNMPIQWLRSDGLQAIATHYQIDQSSLK